MLLKVGLTGGLASGKSEAAVHFENLGAAVIDADDLVHELYQPDAPGTAAVVELFGENILALDGSVSREKLGERVLTNKKDVEALNQQIHPLVRSRIAAWFAGLEATDSRVEVAMVEAALLVETGAYQEYGALVVVWCSKEQQVERAVARGMQRERALALLRAQIPLEEKRRMADHVVDNSGGKGRLETEVRRVWRRLVRGV